MKDNVSARIETLTHWAKKGNRFCNDGTAKLLPIAFYLFPHSRVLVRRLPVLLHLPDKLARLGSWHRESTLPRLM